MDPLYLPLENRKPDTQYRRAIQEILKNGEYTKNPKQENGTYTVLDLPRMSFLLENGIPLITERAIPFWRKSIGEILAFLNGARHLRDFEPYGCANFWKDSVTAKKCADFGLEEGDLGPASYGPVLHDFPNFFWEQVENHPDGGRYVYRPFNQFENIIKGIREHPSLRTHMATTWFPPGALQHSGLQRKVVVAPCHGDLIKITIINGKLTLHQVQRSADMLIGVPSNIFQYAALTLIVAHLTDTIAHKYVHTFLDAQLYENHKVHAEELISRSPLRFPTLRIINPNVKELSQFQVSDFELTDYESHPAMRDIPFTV